nr:uncharacterized protein LOC109175972 isoform X2 [Ipomoea batatas]GME15714.1 uncharacterized protein LOC109175972 isoform X2 [Ipomoea batatas]
MALPRHCRPNSIAVNPSLRHTNSAASSLGRRTTEQGDDEEYFRPFWVDGSSPIILKQIKQDNSKSSNPKPHSDALLKQSELIKLYCFDLNVFTFEDMSDIDEATSVVRSDGKPCKFDPPMD